MQIEQIGEDLASVIENGDTTAAQLSVSYRGERILERSFGARSPHPDAPAVTDTAPFLIASITKPVTATAVMLCADRGLVDIEAPVTEYIPGFTGNSREKVTVGHLLTHTSGLPDMLPENEELRRRNAPRETFTEHVIETPLRFEPGTDLAYQSMGINLAAEIVERVTDTRLRDFMEREIFDPLGMDDTFLGNGDRPSDLVQCDVEVKNGDPGYDRWDWNSAYWRDFGAPWGGLHSTANDLTTFMQTFLEGGTSDGTRILAADTARAMTSVQTEGYEETWGLGWAINDTRPYFGEAVSSRTFGHSGATGTVAWADPERHVVFVCLTTKPLTEHDAGFFGTLSEKAIEALEEHTRDD